MLRYYRLWDLLARRNMKKTDLLEIISSPTLAKLSKGESVNTSVIDKICLFLKCQPEDIMECFAVVEGEKETYTIKENGYKVEMKSIGLIKNHGEDTTDADNFSIRPEIVKYEIKK